MNVTIQELGLEGLDALKELDTLVLFVAEDARPLQGLAGFTDWRMCGALSRLLLNGFFKGALGESALTPADGHIPIPRLMLLGMGLSKRVDTSAMVSLLSSAVERLNKVKAVGVALELPTGAGLQDDARVDAFNRAFVREFKGTQITVLAEKAVSRLLAK